MENENFEVEKKEKGFKYYLKKYGYYFALGGLLLVLSVAVVLTSVFAESGDKIQPTNVSQITFDMPVMNASVLKGYSDTELQYNAVLNVWEIHKAIDFSAEIGTNVLAVYSGTVSSVSKNLLEGTTIEIDHGNGLKTTYGSLDADVNVKVGDVVSKGDVIGKASNSATSETTNQGEVHFEVWKDGNVVDPSSYLNLSNGK